jgi:segregation and condensation protein B
MSEQSSESLHDLGIAVEALLFVAAAPVSMSQLAEALSVHPQQIEEIIRNLSTEYKKNRGLRIECYANRIQLTTAPELAATVERFLGLEATSRLSRAAIETLAIIAYQQPVTRPGIDAIRGVNSDGVLKSLLSKGLVLEIGRAESPGRPILYGTTLDFLQHFGLSSLEELPPYEEAFGEESKNGNGLLKD